ncbi:putative immunoglobulin G-binding protein A [Encephalitozoon hellem]|uniref:Immunoglobulin G-binding protein A n=1 Tax=Encephalitozoon hellem TaxID=27973 RepID=A0ABY8CIK1_ENCHE|nr:putative immunoglobulin G-binding protein A [Encephalitozoon hellem]
MLWQIELQNRKYKKGDYTRTEKRRRPMKFDVLQVLILFGRALCSSLGIEKYGTVRLRNSERIVVFPIIFSGNNAIVLPITRFKDIKKGTQEEMDTIEFISCISHMILSFAISEICYKNNSKLEAAFEREMGKHMEKVSKDALNVYVRGKNTFSELLLMAYNRLFQCDERDERKRRMTAFGKCLVAEADRMIHEIDDMDEESRNKKICFYNYIKSCGEKYCDLKVWKQIICVESIVCNASTSLYTRLPSEQLLGLLAEGYMRKALNEKGFSEEELKKRGYMECSIIDIELLLDTYDRHGCEVMEELVKQIMMGKDGREIDSKYVEKVVQVVDERRRRREIEASRHAAELLGEELSGKKSKGKAKGKKSKKKSGGGG